MSFQCHQRLSARRITGMSRQSRRLLPWTILVAALFWSGLTPTETRASAVTFNTLPGSDSDGKLAATVTFTAVNGGIEISVTNTETGTIAKGQAISALAFSVAGLKTPTLFSEFTGKSVSSSSFTPGAAFPSGSQTITKFDDTYKSGADVIDHWGFSTKGSSVTLATAGAGSGKGNPDYMILPSTGTAGSGSSLNQGKFDPYVLGTANFFLKVAGVTTSTVLTAANFTGLSVSFGTGPDKSLGTVPSAPHPVPEPSNMAIAGLGALGFIGYGLRRRLKK
jgi:hypothetical protein